MSLFVLCLCLAPAWVGAQPEDQEPSWGYALSHELMSPFCPGRTLAACTSPQAAEVRQWILLQEAAGADRGEVILILQERFGDAVRSMPEGEGWGLAAWLLPGGSLAVGAVLVFFILRRMVSRPSTEKSVADASDVPDGSASPHDDDEWARRVEQELAAHKR